MAFMQCQFHSDVLGRACSMNVIIPQKAKTQIGMASSGSGRKDYPVIYLLHGLSDDHTIWMRRTSIERYAADYEAVIVMPNGDRGFYTDMKCGPKYWTMLSEELPAIVQSLFPVSSRREDTFAAGLSMGGYGALKLALRCPNRFAGAVALSAVADIREWFSVASAFSKDNEYHWIFGSAEEIVAQRNDLFELAKTAITHNPPPKIMMACGTSDPLYRSNLRLRDHLSQLNFPGFRFDEGPGKHEWAFWDQWIQEGLRFLLM